MENINYELCNTNNLYYNTIFQYYLLMIVNLFGLFYINKTQQIHLYLINNKKFKNNLEKDYDDELEISSS